MSYRCTIIGGLIVGITSTFVSMASMKDVIATDEDDYVLVSFKEEKKASKSPHMLLVKGACYKSDSDVLVNLIQKAREEAWVHLCILTSNPEAFVHNYKETLIKNGLTLNLPLLDYYKILGISQEDGKQYSHEDIMAHIQKLQEQSAKDEDYYTEKASIMRQVAYPFKTSIGKRCYDALLEGSLKEFVIEYHERNLKKIAAYEQAAEALIQQQSILTCRDLG